MLVIQPAKGILMKAYLPSSNTINGQYYVNPRTKLRNDVTHFHQDNAVSHQTRHVH